MEPTWLVLLPPVLVLISAIITRKLQISLVLGLIAGAFIAQKFALLPSLSLLSERILGQVTDIDNMFVYIFLLCVGMLITVINYTGAATAFAQKLKNKIQTAQ